MSKKSKLLTREGWFKVFPYLRVEDQLKITILSTFYVTVNFQAVIIKICPKKYGLFQ